MSSSSITLNSNVNGDWGNLILKYGKVVSVVFLLRVVTQFDGWATLSFGTIPAGFRPSRTAMIQLRSRNNIPAEITFNSSGNCTVYLTSNGALSVGDVFGSTVTYISD